jgi:sugar transferase (PEP-CTERM/EpsH1 system associated)
MNILFLSQRVPYPPKKGDKLRAFNEIKFLSRNHRISLVCLADDKQDFQYVDELRTYCQSVDVVFNSPYFSNLRALCALFSNGPFTRAYFFAKELKSIVQQRLQKNRYDLIFVYCSSMAQYVEHVQHIPKVIDFVDVDSEKWRQYTLYAKFPWMYVYRSESKRLRAYEAVIARTFQHSFLVSEKEVKDFWNFVSPCSTMTSIPNGVDSDVFRPSSEPYDPHSLVFIGTMNYWPNVEAVRYFCRKILPLIQKTVPDVTFSIVGRNPVKEIYQLKKKYTNILVTGYVEHVQQYVVKSAALVAPMRITRGVQNKILEAMAMGVPVVTTSSGSQGLAVIPGKDIIVEDQPERFAQQVIQLMTNPELRKRISFHARKTIEQYYYWEDHLKTLENILLDIVKNT